MNAVTTRITEGLRKAIQLELSSVQFYEAEAAAVEDENVAAFYQELVVWEQDHYDALIRQLQQLRGEHWDVADFE